MTIERKVGMGIAGQPSGGATDVAEVFSTYLYNGNGSTQTITNGIDLAGEGGLVWIKCRTTGYSHSLYDTERGATKSLSSDLTSATDVLVDGLTSFNNNGFSLGYGNRVNRAASNTFASFTFRKKEKFFDVVTWTGDSSEDQTISHNLNSSVGLIITKKTNASGHWHTFHISKGNGGYGALNANDQFGTGAQWGVTNTTFNADGGLANNATGDTYVAYLFADNSTEDAEDQMIKCGSFNTAYTGNFMDIDLGWEPQYVMFKSSTSADSWWIVDAMRGCTVGGTDAHLQAQISGAEQSFGDYFHFSSTGFRMMDNAYAGNQTWIYMAIRAPMMVEPEAATDVFAVAARTGASGDTPCWVSGFVTDMTIMAEDGLSNNYVATRLTGDRLVTTDDAMAEASAGGKYTWDYMTGFNDYAGAGATNKELMWKRAKGYMDVVCYSGTGSARTVPHSLSVIPEMIWAKCRTVGNAWCVYHSALGATKQQLLTDAIPTTVSGNWNDTEPTDSAFTVGASGKTNSNTQAQIAYLFATLAGISKVGSYTGNGSNQTIACGFSAGSRFILIKRTDATGDWYFWDSLRGIVAGNDPHLSLNTTAAQVTSDDSVDPHNSGFIVNQVSATNINVSSGTYIFYAIA